MYLCDCCLVSMGYPVNNTKNIRSTGRVGIFDGPFLTTNMRRELEGILFFNSDTADFETCDIKQVLPQKTSLGYIMAVERVTEEAVEKYREIYGRKEMPTPTEAEWMKQGIDVDKDKCPYGDNPFGRSAQVIESSAQGTGDSAQ